MAAALAARGARVPLAEYRATDETRRELLRGVEALKARRNQLTQEVAAAKRRAIDALRLEKGYRVWSSDVTPDETPFDAGLGFAVALDKAEPAMAREALVAAKAAGPSRRLRCLVLDDLLDVCLGNEPVRIDGRIVGRVTSGGQGFAVEKSIAYAKERKAFGVSIAEHQLVQAMLAEMAIGTEATRLLYQKAAWNLDHGVRDPIVSSYAKAYGADKAMQTAIDAVQIFGGNGYVKDYPVEKLMRDAKVLQIYEGTSQIQRLVIAKEIFLPPAD